MKIQQATYTAVRTNRDRPRLWIEGVKPDIAGFTRGARYRIDRDGDELVLRLDPDGPRIVSGRRRGARDVPILDLALTEAREVYTPETRVRVLFTSGMIRIAVHHEAQAQAAREDRFLKSVARGMLREASLFTGGGVSTMAIHQSIAEAGIQSEVAWVCDASLKYLQVGTANNYAITDETVALVGRVEEIESHLFAPVDVLSFSAPCAGFSRAGTAKHKQTPEAHESATSLFGIVQAIKSANPALLVSENVTEARNSPAYALLRAELERLGYRLAERTMTSEETGTLESRARFWLIGVSSGLCDRISFENVHEGTLSPQQCVADILDGAEHVWSENSYLKDKAERDAAEGKGFKRQLLTGSETRIGTIGRGYAKRRSTEPMLVNSEGQERLLSPPEHERAKSVPEGLVAGFSNTVAHEVLGQSVDYRQAVLAGRAVLAAALSGVELEEAA